MSHLCQFWFSKRDNKLDNRMMFGILSFLAAMWYVVAVWVPQTVCDEKTFGNHCLKSCNHLLYLSVTIGFFR